MAGLIANLATRHRVALLYLRSKHEPALDGSLMERCELAEEVMRHGVGQARVERWSRRLRLASSLMLQRPMWVTDWTSKAYASRLTGLARTWQPDVIQVEYHVMAQYLHAVDTSPAPRLLVEHEPGIESAPYPSPVPGGFGRWLARLDKRAWRRFERQAIESVQAVVVFTERDGQAILGLAGGTRVERIPLGIPIPEKPLDPAGSPPPSVLFVGNFMHPPNVDAAERLVSSIFPAVVARVPEARLYIVGEQPPARLKMLADERITVTGRVPDLTPFLDRAGLCVAPLRLGGGMRIKVLEALAAGKALVASPLAVEGLDLVDGVQAVLASSDQEFSSAIAVLLGDTERRRALGASARAWACASLDWGRSVAAYEELYASLIEASHSEPVASGAGHGR